MEEKMKERRFQSVDNKWNVWELGVTGEVFGTNTVCKENDLQSQN